MKPYKVGNICNMTYSVLNFLILSLKHIFPQENPTRICFYIKYPNSETVIYPFLVRFRACQVDVLPTKLKKNYLFHHLSNYIAISRASSSEHV